MLAQSCMMARNASSPFLAHFHWNRIPYLRRWRPSSINHYRFFLWSKKKTRLRRPKLSWSWRSSFRGQNWWTSSPVTIQNCVSLKRGLSSYPKPSLRLEQGLEQAHSSWRTQRKPLIQMLEEFWANLRADQSFNHPLDTLLPPWRNSHSISEPTLM